MQFYGSDRYFRTSEDGAYRVAKIIVKGETTYELWRKTVDGWEQVGVGFKSFDAAASRAADSRQVAGWE